MPRLGISEVRPATVKHGGSTLEERVEKAGRLEAVRKRDLRFGDCVIVQTKNSLYSIHALGGDLYHVSGGWFDREGASPQKITIHGCTWGGSAIKQDIVAAPGLYLEFGNSVVTTRIQSVLVIPATTPQLPA